MYKICAMIFSHHANDVYYLPFSIKDDNCWAAKDPKGPNVFPKPKDRFPGAAEFNQLMVNFRVQSISILMMTLNLLMEGQTTLDVASSITTCKSILLSLVTAGN